MKKTKKWFTCGLTLLIAGCISIEARPQSSTMNVKRAIEMALTNNYSLKADSMSLVSSAYQQKVTKANLLPQANYVSKTEYNLAIPSQMLPGSMLGQPAKEFVPVKFGTRYNISNGVEVTQSIFNKAYRLQVASARLNSEISETRHKLSREELVYEVATSFYTLQTNEEMIRTTNGDYLNLCEILKIAKAQFETGVLKRIDYESLQINAANKQSQLDQLQSKNREQLDYFKYLLGLPVSVELMINDSIGAITEWNEIAGSPALAREDIHLSYQLIQSKELEIKTIRAEQSPSVSSYFRFSYLSQFNKVADISNNDYRYKSSTVGLMVNMPLFDGYRRKNRIQVADAQLLQLNFQRLQQQELAQTEWASANETLNSGRRQYQITQQNLLLAEKVFNSRKALYAEGVTTLIELLDAEKELSQARNLHVQAMISVHTAMVNVYKAKGTLLTEFIKSI